MAGHNVNVCDIGVDIKERLKKFRFQKHVTNSALILKVDREKQLLVVDEDLDDISLEELQETLPGHQPRFIVYSYKMEHDDGRVSFPICFIFYTPRDAHMELQVRNILKTSTVGRNRPSIIGHSVPTAYKDRPFAHIRVSKSPLDRSRIVGRRNHMSR